MFHIAHPLYATDKPDEKFPDSRIIGPDGRQTAYGGRDNTKYYSKYFEPQQVEQGYRWFAFYPTTKNSFGKAMLQGVDMMLGDEIGCTGMFADGYTHSYGGWYTYDRWDGHTVEIDPKTKTVKRKMGAVNLLGPGRSHRNHPPRQRQGWRSDRQQLRWHADHLQGTVHLLP